MTSPLIKFFLISYKLDRCHVSLDLRRHQYVERNLVAIFLVLTRSSAHLSSITEQMQGSKESICKML